MPGLIKQFENLLDQLDSCCEKQCDQPCQSTLREVPFAQVCFTCPPCGPLPTNKCTVKPLQMPCMKISPSPEQIAAEMAAGDDSRYNNFYNMYNVNYRTPRGGIFAHKNSKPTERSLTAIACTIDGKDPHCTDPNCRKVEEMCCDRGCPTGFKPCTMKLCPPLYCNPIAAWHAEVQPCPPK